MLICDFNVAVAPTVYQYDARSECKFNSLLRHRIFLSAEAHCYIWCPIMVFINLLFGQKYKDILFEWCDAQPIEA